MLVIALNKQSNAIVLARKKQPMLSIICSVNQAAGYVIDVPCFIISAKDKGSRRNVPRI